MPLFEDRKGLPLKFFIQKDISAEIQAELSEAVQSLGGRVEEKVPRQGYILLHPGTAEADRLRTCWLDVENRPDRYFVPYTYVEACKAVGTLLPQIFLDGGLPIAINIHSSIANVNARNSLVNRILHSGGNPHASAKAATVILADPNTDVFQHLIKTYEGSLADKHIESYLWVKKCVEQGKLTYTPLVYKNPGGRRAGEERTPFTPEDDINLCKWLTIKIPFKEDGGRTGNRVYQQLCELSLEPTYTWVSRHTWQSWRERYKKNSARLDIIIDGVVEETKPKRGAPGQLGYTRATAKKRKRISTQNTAVDSSDDATASATQNSMMAIIKFPENNTTNSGSSIKFGRSTNVLRPNQDEEEMDEEEWGVKVGVDPPPTWSKSDDKDSNASRKKQKKQSSKDGPVQDTQTSNEPKDPVVTELEEIATEFKFTIGEVETFYDKCHEMTKTRKRFKKMREFLDASELDED